MWSPSRSARHTLFGVTRLVWLGRSPAWRAGAIIAVILLVGAAWYLGSPLFIRTTVHEDLPVVTAAPQAAPAARASSSAAAAPAITSLPSVAGITAPAILAEGQLQFVDSIHNGKGPVRLIRLGDQRFLRFEDVAITNAPDVHVYLSRETGGKWSDATSLYLGPLKATNGSFNYDIPAAADLSAYKSVVVWCRAFSVLVTWADLKPA